MNPSPMDPRWSLIQSHPKRELVYGVDVVHVAGTSSWNWNPRDFSITHGGTAARHKGGTQERTSDSRCDSHAKRHATRETRDRALSLSDRSSLGYSQLATGHWALGAYALRTHESRPRPPVQQAKKHAKKKKRFTKLPRRRADSLE